MCGIFGLYNTTNKDVKAAMALLSARGTDGVGWFNKSISLASNYNKLIFSESGLGHVLHAMVNTIPQPLQRKGALVVNGEIYNWELLAKKYSKIALNDADLLLQLLDDCSLEKDDLFSLLEELDGVFAFVYERDKNVILARDIIGVKPLWFSHQDGFCFASEKKVLLAAGFSDLTDLNPRTVLVYNKKNNLLSRWQRSFFDKSQLIDKSEEEHALKVKDLIVSAVKKRIPAKAIKVGILFSGGVDSTIIAKVCHDEGFDVTCYTSVVDNPRADDPHDLVAAKKVAQRYGFNLKIIQIKEENISSLARETTKLIEEANAVKVSVGMPFLAAAKVAREDGCKVLFSGLGAEELFAGYQRHKNSVDVNNECFAGLLWLYERDLYRDDVITMRNGLELRLPLLDKELTQYALSIPAELKLKDGKEKYILRKAALLLGLDEEDAFRPKKAAQYGSRFDHALERLARSQGFNRVQYLQTFLFVKNRRIGILCSGGKDSWYAAFVMKNLNYDLTCCLTIKSDNDDSYMFHTPAIELVKLQAKSANIPFLEQFTKGEKEKELDDLRLLLQRAKDEFQIDGVVTGALFSQYQRSRVEKLCDELNLKAFAPLWHLEQESALRELLRENFVITLSSIAGDGLSKDWLGKEIGEKEVNALVSLRDKIGFHVAGEGGEYESLVLDCPLFSKKLMLDFKKVMENNITGRIVVKKAWLAEKLPPAKEE